MQSRFGYNADGEFVDASTNQPPTLTQLHDADVAHDAVMRAESLFETALRKRYGSRAGDMRYRTNELHTDVRDLALAYQAAMEAWRATWRLA